MSCKKLLATSDDLSFDLVPSKEEVADSGGEPYTTSFLLYPFSQPNATFRHNRESFTT